jgi:hypothetical protein
MSDSELEELVSDISQQLKEIRAERSTAYSENNWWSDQQIIGKMNIDANSLKILIETSVKAALDHQAKSFASQLQEIEEKFKSSQITSPEVEVFKDAEIDTSVECHETLDIVKSVPDFEGKHETYVSWRKAAHTAYKIFEVYQRSSKHYQALGIIRNKIKGPADMVLSLYDTPLNFKAIINRLDFTYADKRPIYLIEQELSTLRQGNLTLIEYYDEVERKLTLLINKTIMTYDASLAASLNEKYRADALRVFISGTKKQLSDILFSARPKDLPSALALAQEVESNHERFHFANNYARSLEDRAQRNEQRYQKQQTIESSQQGKSPYYNKPRINNNGPPQRQEAPQPMDIDSSSRFRQPTQHQANQGVSAYSPFPNQTQKRPNSGTARFTGPKQQRINNISQEDHQYDPSEQEYDTIAESEVADFEDETAQTEELNFLEMTPCYRL